MDPDTERGLWACVWVALTLSTVSFVAVFVWMVALTVF